MFTFDISKFVPRFLLNDKNGRALAKAMEAGLNLMNEKINESVDILTDYDKMPEWRLDELAWEYNCLYDFNGELESKRRWIKNAIPMYKLHGTAESLKQYLSAMFEADGITIEEGNEPFHFRVIVENEPDPKQRELALQAINKAKNIRSVFDGFILSSEIYDMTIVGECGILDTVKEPTASEDLYSGQYPKEVVL